MNGPAWTDDLRGARVTVLGLGLFGGGVAAARWAAARGARVCVTDLRDADALAPSLEALADVELELVLGEHREADLADADVVIVNPAVPPHAEPLRWARAGGATLTSEFELALDALPGKAVLITGTQGKSSTTHFLGQLLTATDRGAGRTHVGGNLGRSLLDGLEAVGADDTTVLEVSSYQLEALAVRPRPHVSLVAITNVLADHLERHADVGSYARAKARILGLVGDGGTALLPAGLARRDTFARREGVRTLAHGPDAELTRRGSRFLSGQVDLGDVEQLTVPGAFQWDNALVALGAAHALGRDADALAAAIGGLTGLPHRLEPLAAVSGRDVMDNGVSTTPDSTLAALESVVAPCTLLAGGRAKAGLHFDELAERIGARGDRVVAFGEAGEAIARACQARGARVFHAPRFEDAVRVALERTPVGETLLFSPACSSFDGFPNFRARAEAFRALLQP